jgi:CheY-like chemotaxis protein
MMTESIYQYDVFISYSHHDEEWVHGWLLPQLDSCGINTCIDIRDFEPGAPSLLEMEHAVQKSRRVLLVLTPNYVASEWTEFENILAQTLDPAARQRRVLPLLLNKDTELPLRIRALTYLDFSPGSRTQAELERLIKHIKEPGELPNRPKLLYIENDLRWLNMVKTVLSDYSIQGMLSSQDAIQVLQAGIHYDLVLVNLHLTDFHEASGTEVLEYIRDYQPSLPRIVLTGEPPRSGIFSNFFEGYQITELMIKAQDNTAELRQMIRKILESDTSGSQELRQRKEELLNQLKDIYDISVSHVSEGIKALDTYAARLRREIGVKQSEELTRPDREALIKRRGKCKVRYDDLRSHILAGSDRRELDAIHDELRNGWE